ncbi:MAG TPA: BMP family ABC transporter substrate-binding protein [Aggregatilineales bacterium]|nr:BMP family ABC transporter substrate-binding protein [Aggregatilineales bacterium]
MKVFSRLLVPLVVSLAALSACAPATPVAPTGAPAAAATQASAPAATAAPTAAPTIAATQASAPAATTAPTAASAAVTTQASAPAATTAPTAASAAPATQVSIPAGNLVVGFVLVGPKDDKGWSQAQWGGAQYAAQKVGGVTAIPVEALDPNVTLDQIVQNLKGQGAKMIVTTSDFFQDDTTAAAKKYPDITFINASGDAVHKGTAPSNLGNVMGRMEYMKMVGGCAAALNTQKGSIAYLGPLINDETRRLVNSAYLGASYCWKKYRNGDPTALKFQVKWIGFWFNQPGKTLDPTEVTNGFYDGGADVVLSGIDTTEALVVAKQRADKGEKIWVVPYDYKDACTLAPTVCLGVPYFNWGPAYAKLIGDFKAGNWKQSWDWNGPDWADINNPDSSAVGFVFGDALTADQKTTLQGFTKDLGSDNFTLFKGPLNFQDGTQYLADGQVATDNQIWYMPQLLQGVVGNSK